MSPLGEGIGLVCFISAEPRMVPGHKTLLVKVRLIAVFIKNTYKSQVSQCKDLFLENTTRDLTLDWHKIIQINNSSKSVVIQSVIHSLFMRILWDFAK